MSFSEGLAECLSQGHFRPVLALDEAPQEFVTEEPLIDRKKMTDTARAELIPL